MKKNLLAASLALALGSMSGVASAALEVNHNGVGQINVLPYYSVQDSYNTLMTITNTDAVNGKVVKIRFRAAEWSDDALDFQIFMSPNDVWTGAFGIVDGKLVLKTNDKTCSLPAALDGQEFTSIRVEGRNVDSLKEGYVEIITMADIPPLAQNVAANRADYDDNGSDIANPLFTAIEHDNGVAACGSILTNLKEDSLRSPVTAAAVNPTTVEVAAANQVTWMKPATASLTSSATIIAVSDSKAFTVPGVALRGDVGVGAGTESFTQVQYYRQANAPFTPDAPANNSATVKAVDNLTMDRLFWPKSDDGTGYTVFQFDLPDLSTPFNTVDTARARRNAVATLLAKSTVASDYVISKSIKASTDVVFSQPVRRYFYVYDAAASDAVFGTGYNRTISGAKYLVGGEASTVYAALTPSNKIEIGGPTFYDREERTFVPETDIVVSPQEPGEEAAFFLEGEVSVVSIKKNGDAAAPTGALGARLTNVDWGFTQDYDAGWAKIDTRTVDAAGNPISGLPLVGFTAINIFNQSAGAAGTNYGQVLPLRNLAPMAP